MSESDIKPAKTRANWIAAPHFFNLSQACAVLWRAFPDGGIYLVGSSIARRDHRDVDVRCILEDTAYDRLFRVDPNSSNDDGGGYYNALWSVMCTSISMQLSHASGLPVDFQIQRQTQANATHGGPRHAIGLFHDYPGETPVSVALKARELRDSDRTGTP